MSKQTKQNRNNLNKADQKKIIEKNKNPVSFIFVFLDIQINHCAFSFGKIKMAFNEIKI